MPDRPVVRVFVSSPADVRPERLLAERIIARLDREVAYHFHVEAVLWERERLGVLLPENEYRGAISGGSVTGTEWEFEDALAAARKNGVPHLILYRKQQ